MASQARDSTGAREIHRRLVPVGLVVFVYVMAGILWILGSGPVADMFTEATSIPRWIVELGKGVLFVVATAVVLLVVLRRRADRLDVVAATGDENTRRLIASEDRNRLPVTALSGEDEERAVRGVYLVVLAVPIVLVLAVSLAGVGSDDAFRRIALPGLLVINGILMVLVWRRRVSLAVLGLWVFLGPAAWVLGRLVIWELAPSTRPDNFGLLIAALAWYGVVFALAFLVFGTRIGAKVAFGSYLLLYLGATVSAVGGMLADSGSIGVVVFLAAGHFVLILVVWVLARNVERLASARARAELMELQATTDPLTGIANRRRVDEELLRQVARARRYRQPFAAVLVDLDHFKAVNDTYGHEVGDEVLVTAVARLRSAIRETDLLGRWGGEEFVILAPQTSHADACALAERCRVAMTAHGKGDPGQRITASFGVATLDVDEDDARSLMRRADLAMYAAKSEGRDRVVGVAAPFEAGGMDRSTRQVAVGEDA